MKKKINFTEFELENNNLYNSKEFIEDKELNNIKEEIKIIKLEQTKEIYKENENDNKSENSEEENPIDFISCKRNEINPELNVIVGLDGTLNNKIKILL